MNACYQNIITILRPGAEFTITDDNNYNNIVWTDTTQTKPTEEEIISKINELNTILGWEILRIERNKLLKETDKYMVLDYPNLSESKKNEWITYRQLLRDLPLNANPSVDEESELINITWPQQPS
tara:strand:- start:65 stop:439 length:375 start_codon:yes stop_codon:yes gene_type:complete